MTKPLHLADVTLSASTSFAEAEVVWLDHLLSTLRRGGDVRAMAARPECASLAGKVPAMFAQIDRNRETRERIRGRSK